MADGYTRYSGLGGGGGGGNTFSEIKITGSTSGTLTLTVPPVVNSYTLVFPDDQGAAGQTLVNDGMGQLYWADSADITIGTIDGQSPSANGLVLTGNMLYAQSASAAVPGMVNLTTQSFAGNKTFTGTIVASNLSGTNTGNVTIGTANGLSIVGQALSLALSSTGTTGALSNTDWNTFNSKQAALSFGNLSAAGTDGIAVTGGTGAVIGAGTSIAQQVATAGQNGYLSSANWTTFNSKQAAGNYITALTGDVTASGPGSVAASIAATSNATLVTLSALTTAASLSTVGTITVGTWSGTTIALNKGGTGQTTKAAAFDALSPMSASGDLIYGGASGTGTALVKQNDGDVLTLVSGLPAWGALVPTGITMDYVGTTAPTGWLLLSGLTIGSAASGGTARANADTSNLFTLLWNSSTNTELPIQDSSGVGTTRGANAAADFAANKRLPLPDARGRVIVGKDNMGGSTASRMTTGGAGIDGTVQFAAGGTQTHVLTTSQLAAHTHTGMILPVTKNFVTVTSSGSNAQDGTCNNQVGNNVTGSTGSDAAHQNTQPSIIMSKIVKL